MSLREKQAASRRRQMLDAAERLIRQSGNTDFSMRALSNAAEVSPTTPYNFFGSKEGLLFELLTRHLERFLNETQTYTTEDPTGQVIEGAVSVVEMFLQDPVLLRPLHQVMLGIGDPLHHPQYLRSAFMFYSRALEGVQAHGLIDEDERAILASALMSNFLGVLYLWIHEDIGDVWFRAQIVYGFSHLLLPHARGDSLTLLQQKCTEAKQVLADPALRPRLLGRPVGA
jgi:AcrR family transcriptional regulator